MTVTPLPPVSTHSQSPPLGRLWFGIGAAPAAWTVMELVGYALAARSCEPGVYELPPQGTMGARLWVVGLAIVTTAVAAAGLYVALTSLRATTRRAPDRHRPNGDVTHDSAARATRARFMAIAGIFVSAVFLLGTVLFGLPPLIVNGCVQTR